MFWRPTSLLSLQKVHLCGLGELWIWTHRLPVNAPAKPASLARALKSGHFDSAKCLVCIYWATVETWWTTASTTSCASYLHHIENSERRSRTYKGVTYVCEFPSKFIHLYMWVMSQGRLKTSYHKAYFLYSLQQCKHVLLAYRVTHSITWLTVGADWEVRRSVR